MLAAKIAIVIPADRRVGELPLHHKDPFDRILVAQAQIEDMQLVTMDRLVAAYDVAIIWAEA